jgi:putative N6-adenine-specific DNA methylase
MSRYGNFEIFLVAAPGLEEVLCAEVRMKGFKQPKAVPGGVVIKGGWPEVWRANLWIRGAGRVLARLESFHIDQLTELENRARKVRWGDVLRPDVPFSVEATCKQSRIFHSEAVAERFANAIHDKIGAPFAKDADVIVMVRFDNDLCTVSIDTSGDLLHKRGLWHRYSCASVVTTAANRCLIPCAAQARSL